MRVLHTRRKNGPEGNHIGVCTRMRLDIGVIGAKQATGELSRALFDVVDIVAPGVKPVIGDAFGVFVGEQIAHGQLGGQRAIVFTGNHLEISALVGQFGNDTSRNFG